MYLNLMFVYFLMPIESVSFAPLVFLNHETIRNNIFGYGQYCGPGPDEALWPFLQPIDEIDEACHLHDDAYRICYENLSTELGYPVPKFIHQIMAMRGVLPLGFLRKSFLYSPDYLRCMHQADKMFIQLLEPKLEQNQYPLWWKNFATVPINIEGTEGFEEVCSLGFSSFGYCIIASKEYFQLVLQAFKLSISTDLPYLTPVSLNSMVPTSTIPIIAA